MPNGDIFETLGIAPDATVEEIIQRAGSDDASLCQLRDCRHISDCGECTDDMRRGMLLTGETLALLVAALTARATQQERKRCADLLRRHADSFTARGKNGFHAAYLKCAEIIESEVQP